MNDGKVMKQHLMAKQKTIPILTEDFHKHEFYTIEKSICTVVFLTLYRSCMVYFFKKIYNISIIFINIFVLHISYCRASGKPIKLVKCKFQSDESE